MNTERWTLMTTDEKMMSGTGVSAHGAYTLAGKKIKIGNQLDLAPQLPYKSQRIQKTSFESESSCGFWGIAYEDAQNHHRGAMRVSASLFLLLQLRNVNATSSSFLVNFDSFFIYARVYCDADCCGGMCTWRPGQHLCHFATLGGCGEC